MMKRPRQTLRSFLWKGRVRLWPDHPATCSHPHERWLKTMAQRDALWPCCRNSGMSDKPLARILKCSPEYLMGWDEDNLTEVKIEFNDYFPLHYSTNLSAGTLDELLDSEPDAVVYVPIVFQMKRKRLHAFKVNGTSMDNVFPDGSIVISESVTAIDSLKDGAIVVVWVNGTATVKRLYIGEHQITLMPDSTDKSHQPILVDTDINTVTVIGRVIWHMNPDDISKTY